MLVLPMVVYAVVNNSLSATTRSATRSRPSSAAKTQRFIDEVRGDDPELASYLRIEERELEAGGLK